MQAVERQEYKLRLPQPRHQECLEDHPLPRVALGEELPKFLFRIDKHGRVLRVLRRIGVRCDEDSLRLEKLVHADEFRVRGASGFCGALLVRPACIVEQVELCDFREALFALAFAVGLELAKYLLACGVRLRALASVADLRLKLLQIRCNCLVYRPRGLRLLGSLDDTVLHCLEERTLTLRSGEGVRWLRPTLLPSQLRVVKADAVGAFCVALFAPFDHHHVGDDLAFGVEDRAAIPPLPIGKTYMLPNAHFSVHSHRPLPLILRFERNRGETLERTLERNAVALRSQWVRKEMAPQVGFEPTTLRLTAGCSAIELLRSVTDTG